MSPFASGRANQDAASFRAAVCALCRDVLPTWRNVVEVRTEPITGGITNELNMVTPMAIIDDETTTTITTPLPPPVVVRVYGEGTDKFLDRALETRALLELNAQGFGARCLGVFANGRIEEALLNTRPLSPAEMADPAVARRIAARIFFVFVHVPISFIPLICPVYALALALGGFSDIYRNRVKAELRLS